MNSYVININVLILLFVCYTCLDIMAGIVVGYLIGKFTGKKQKSEKIW